jgi:hypothetical protein
LAAITGNALLDHKPAVDETDNNGILNLLTHPEILPAAKWNLDAEFGL